VSPHVSHTSLGAETKALEPMAVTRLRSFPKNARVHSKKQIRQIAASIEKFGFTNPVLISDEDEIIAGHGRVEAAKLLGMEERPDAAPLPPRCGPAAGLRPRRQQARPQCGLGPRAAGDRAAGLDRS
jgi:hypothetical protein